MNPIRLLKLARRASRLLDLMDRGSKDWDARKDKGEDMSKSLFTSKTFWFNVLTAAAELSQVLPLPAGTLAIVATVVNIGLRMVTDQPVHLVSPKS